ncbi:DUF397 domain-containing protein (plasmid) [Streptomyces sp. R39]|uniref:DUF397 domain-containing protein n=1 Tax=Streptomyces sp. R39 TaxID=3238631 RepID=A0AB39R5M3_9ACTN
MPDPSPFDPAEVEWTVSSYSGGSGDCVRVGRLGDLILVGDTKCPDRLPLRCTTGGVRAWIRAVKDGTLGPAEGSS